MAKQALQKVTEKNISDTVLNRIFERQASGGLQLPKNYNPQNALMSAYLILQETKDKNGKSVLESCTQPSIVTSLMNMVTQGLNPAKSQCYFIAYGNQLTMQRSYLGTIAITKRLEGVVDVKGYPVYKNDEFKLGFDLMSGRQTVAAYSPGTDRSDKDLVGAFALIIGEKEIIHTEYMTMEQIRKAWEQGQTSGKSPAHTKFPDQMAVKTVINRACKTYAKTSDDSDLSVFLSAEVDSEVESEIEEHANRTLLSVESVEYENVEEDPVPEGVDPETGEVEEDLPDFLKEGR